MSSSSPAVSRSLLATAACGVMLLALPGAADAAVSVLPSQTFALGAATGHGGVPGQDLSFSLFDPALGTLTGVTILFNNSTAAATANVQIVSGTPGDDSVTVGISSTLEAAVGLLSVVQGVANINQMCTFGMTCATPLVEPASFSTPTPFTLASPGDDVSGFAGIGTFVLGLNINVANIFVSPDNQSGTMVYDASGSVAWEGSVTVSYTYDAVAPPTTDTPEPGSLALLATGLGLAALRRRRAWNNGPAGGIVWSATDRR